MDFEIAQNGFDFLTPDDPSNRNRKLKLGCFRKMSHEPQIMMICVSTLYDKIWSSYGNFKIWLTFGPGDVIDDIMSGKILLVQLDIPIYNHAKYCLCGTSPS